MGLIKSGRSGTPGRYLGGYKKKRNLSPSVQEGTAGRTRISPGNCPFLPSLTMTSIYMTQVFFALAFLNLATSLPVREDYQVENFLSQMGHLNGPWTPSELFVDTLLEATLRRMLSAGLERRRQLGDIEFSNRYSEFLRSKAKHSSVCSLLRRMQGIKKSASGGDVEKVNQLLRQYMCPSVYNNWPADL